MKRKVFLIVSIIMLLFATGFVIYALNNPQASFPWSNTITYTIYLIYIGIMIGFFALSLFLKKHNKASGRWTKRINY